MIQDYKDRNTRKPYHMYVLNLDAARIFWLTTLLILLIVFSFFSGVIVGRVKAKMDVNQLSQKNKVVMDDILNKLNSKGTTNEEEFQFYELMSPKKSNPTKPLIENRSQTPEPPPHQEFKYSEPVKENHQDPSPNIKTIESLSQQGDFSIQVAAYKSFKSAKDLEVSLKSLDYPAYVTRSLVKGIFYYRVKIGPFKSRALSLKVLESLRQEKEGKDSFLTRPE